MHTFQEFFGLLSLSNWSLQSAEYFFTRAKCRAHNDPLPAPVFPEDRSQAGALFSMFPSSGVVMYPV
jgi:hypothetical protein